MRGFELTGGNVRIVRVQAAINCLKELRTALISVAVTGKIDVRKVMAGPM